MDDQVIIAGGGGGKAGGSGGGLNESPDTLKSTSYAQVLDLICEGEIGGLVNGLQSIYLDDTPIQNADGTSNFTGVTYIATTGTQTQGVIAGFDQVTNEIAVATEAKFSTVVARSITNTLVTSVAVTVQFPSLTYMDSSGNLGAPRSTTPSTFRSTAAAGSRRSTRR
jgi:predicted phage tail protein